MREIVKLSDNTKQYFDTYFLAVDDLENAIKSISPSDSISQNYILQVLPMFEASNKMSENILAYSTSFEIETLAKAIINDGEKNLENLLSECEDVTNAERDNNLYMRRFDTLFNTMITKMRNLQSDNNINRSYLLAMQYHHEGLIEITKNLLRYDICPSLRQSAQKLLVSLALQLQVIKNLLRRTNI